MMIEVYGIFQPTLDLELGINTLKEVGFTEERLAVVVLDPLMPGKQTVLDSMFKNDGMSLLDGITMAASIGMLFGVIYGSIVSIGPIALGLIGMGIGGLIGYLLDKYIQPKNQPTNQGPSGDIIVSVRCQTGEEILQAEQIMKKHQVVALGRRSGTLGVE